MSVANWDALHIGYNLLGVYQQDVKICLRRGVSMEGVCHQQGDTPKIQKISKMIKKSENLKKSPKITFFQKIPNF